MKQTNKRSITLPPKSPSGQWRPCIQVRRHQAEVSTTNSIASCPKNTLARGRFDIQSMNSQKHLYFKPNQQLTGMKSAQSATKFVVIATATENTSEVQHA